MEVKKVAIQGFHGCFHEQAARIFYQQHQGIVPDVVECVTFDDLFSAMEGGEANAAIMAIENTLSGGLFPNFELLRKHDKSIKGEIFLRIVQNLMAMPGETIESLKEVRTHYMAINQTREFFKDYPWIRLVESEDTAKSAMDVSQNKLRGVGAIASELAAQLYGLDILAPSIETYKQNFTRFLILDDGLIVPKEEINKCSMCFTLPHKPGALAHILTILSFYDMSLTRIQSLPIPGQEWQYFFYVDIKFDDYTKYEQAISASRPLMKDLKILGEYHTTI